MKKKFLVDDIENVKSILEAKSDNYNFYPYPIKTTYVYEIDDAPYVLEEYKKSLKGLSLLLLLSESDKEIIEELSTLKDVSKDKRYSKKYLKHYGSPAKYNFDIDSIFSKCDSVGLCKMQLHFTKPMNSAKVFKVLLYRLNQLLKLNMQKNENSKVIDELIIEIKEIFEVSKGLFDKTLIQKLKYYLKDRELFLRNLEVQDEYFLNFDAFIKDTSDFYEGKKANNSIYNFVRKSIFKNLQKANNSTKNIKYINNTEALIKQFYSMFKEKELEAIRFQIDSLKNI